jgi:hypothetical protein
LKLFVGIRVKRDGRTERFNVRILPITPSFVRIANIENKIKKNKYDFIIDILAQLFL